MLIGGLQFLAYSSGICNLQSVLEDPQAIGGLARPTRSDAGNMPPLPGFSLDYPLRSSATARKVARSSWRGGVSLFRLG